MNKTLVTILEFGFVLIVVFLAIPAFIHFGTTFYATITDAPPPIEQPVAVTPVGPAPPPPVLADTPNDQTENNLLARLIVKDLAQQVSLGRHPEMPVPDLTIHTDVDTSPIISGGKAMVNVTIIDWPDGSFSETYRPAFAWDADGYAPLAEQLLGGASAETAADAEAPLLLDNLEKLTGPELANEDKRLSELLQKNPLNIQEQEEAALLLAALAWRENAGRFSDTRNLLCKATAHLALAQALRGKVQPSWNGRIAETLLLVLSGRETDALQHLDQLSSLADCPDSARTWIMAMRLWLKEDWRMAQITGDSPLVLKLAWFQTLARSVPDQVATAKLNALPNLEKVPDWGRAILETPGSCSAECGHRFTNSIRFLEFQELNEVLQAEGKPKLHDYDLADDFSAPESATVSTDAKGHSLFQVIGADTFKAASRRHLFNELLATEDWMRNTSTLTDQADLFIVEMNILFRSVPFYEMVNASYLPHQDPSDLKLADELRMEKKTWEVSDLPPALALRLFPDKQSTLLLSGYYRKIVPFGTAYQPNHRTEALDLLNAFISQYPDDAQRLLQDMPTSTDFLQKLEQLHPSSYALVKKSIYYQTLGAPGGNLPKDQEMKELSPFFDYNSHALNDIYLNFFYALNDAEKQDILTKRTALDPSTFFDLGSYLRTSGKLDEAAQADRQGVQQGYDPVLIANSIEPLVLYDEDHGKPDEALQLAKQATATSCKGGLATYIHLQEKRRQWNEAETWAKKIADRYNDKTELIALYSRHQDIFPGKYDAILKTTFPNGKISADLTSFSGTPVNGVRVSDSNSAFSAAGLQPGDVIVALDGLRVENSGQFSFLQQEANATTLDIVAWRQDHYFKTKLISATETLLVKLTDYAVK